MFLISPVRPYHDPKPPPPLRSGAAIRDGGPRLEVRLAELEQSNASMKRDLESSKRRVNELEDRLAEEIRRAKVLEAETLGAKKAQDQALEEVARLRSAKSKMEEDVHQVQRAACPAVTWSVRRLG